MKNLICFYLCNLILISTGYAEGIRCESVTEESLFFGDQTVKLIYSVQSTRTREVELKWHVSRNQVVIASRQRTLKLFANRKTKTEIELEFPKPRAGIPLELKLSIVIDSNPVHQRVLRVVSRNPLSSLKKQIVLYDPVGTTRKLFSAVDVSHRVIHREAEFADVRDSIILIGEGISWSESRTLSQTIRQCLQRENQVICLCPEDGKISLTDLLDSDLNFAGQLQFSDSRIIQKLIPGVLKSSLQTDGELESKTLHLAGMRNGISLEVQKNAEGWIWMEYQQPNLNSQFIVCMLPVVSKWNDGPLPRHLLAAILK
ncbi:MAG: hypothetical protein QM501_00775 [Gimesia sp.]